MTHIRNLLFFLYKSEIKLTKRNERLFGTSLKNVIVLFQSKIKPKILKLKIIS